MSENHLEACYAFRADLVQEIAKDLIGPQLTDETIHDAPLDQYVTAILYPQGDHAQASEDDGSDAESGGDESAASDPPVAMANVQTPSSMGITFAVDSTATTLSITVDAARYQPSGTHEGQPRRGRIGTGDVRWKRHPIDAAATIIDVRSNDAGTYRPIADKTGAEIEGLRLFTRVREPDKCGARSVTVALVNTFERPQSGELRDA